MTAQLSGQQVALQGASGFERSSLMPSRSWVATSLFSLVTLSALFVGWSIKDEYLLTAESGLGYALGIMGGTMMMALLMYPLRKRFYQSSVFIFSTKNWFKLHMILGVLGPLLVLYHCNFGLGSTNSNIALASMLLMVASGLVGRFIYGKIHYGLYGKKMELRELLDSESSIKQQLFDDQNREVIFISEQVMDRLRAYEQSLIAHRSFLGTLFNVATLGLTTRLSYLAVMRTIKLEQRNNQRYMQLPVKERRKTMTAIRRHIFHLLSTVRQIAGLKFYERLFSLWHMLHLPIFFMLIITGFVHVYAVHTY